MIPGTVLISRNDDEALNTSPGHWNHCAIYVGDASIVEALSGQGVVLTPFADYEAGNWEWIALQPLDHAAGLIAANKAITLLGLPYRLLSSVRLRVRREERGMNCVDAAFRVPYEHALQRRFGSVHWPDDVVNVEGVFVQNQRKT